MDNPRDTDPEKSSTQQRPDGKNNPQNCGDEEVGDGSETRGSFSSTIRGGSSGESREGSRMRRGRSHEEGASSSVGQRGRRRKVDAGVPAVCAVCNRTFTSFYALFGHLRSHSKREWGGAFPPPKYTSDWASKGSAKSSDDQKKPVLAATQQVIEREVIPALLDVAQETLAKMQEQEKEKEKEILDGSRVDQSRRKELELDLNVQPDQEDGSSDQEKGASSGTGFDLNLPPPIEDDDDASASGES